MAFYQDEELNQDPNAVATQPTSGQSGIISGQGAAPSAGGPAPAAGAAANSAASSSPGLTPDNPGNFVGIKQYLDANKTQADKLGSQVAGQVSNQINAANNDINGLGPQFQQQANAGQIPGIATAQNDATNIIQNAGSGTTAADKARYQQVAGAQYGGPSSLESTSLYQPVYNEAQQAKTQANLTKNEAGNETLLQQDFGNPGYTSGENRLDSYLLNSAPNVQKLADARNQAGSIDTNFANVSAGAKDYAATQQQETDAIRAAVAKAMGAFSTPASGNTPAAAGTGALGSFQDTVDKQLADKKIDLAGLQSRINAGTLTDADKALLGVPTISGTAYGTKLSDFYKPGNPTLAGVTTPEEMAKYQALLSLSGQDTSGANPLYAGATAGETGTYKPTFDSQAYQTAIATNKAAYNTNNQNYLAKYLGSIRDYPWEDLNIFFPQDSGAHDVPSMIAYMTPIMQALVNMGYGPKNAPGQNGYAWAYKWAQGTIDEINANQIKNGLPAYSYPGQVK